MSFKPVYPGQLVGLIPPGADNVIPVVGPLARVRAYDSDLHLAWRYTAKLDGLHVDFSLCRLNPENKFYVLDKMRVHGEPGFSLAATRDALTAQDLEQTFVSTLREVFPKLVIQQPGPSAFDDEIQQQKDNLHEALSAWFLPGDGLDALVDCVYDLASDGITAPFASRHKQQPRPGTI